MGGGLGCLTEQMRADVSISQHTRPHIFETQLIDPTDLRAAIGVSSLSSVKPLRVTVQGSHTTPIEQQKANVSVPSKLIIHPLFFHQTQTILVLNLMQTTALRNG